MWDDGTERTRGTEPCRVGHMGVPRTVPPIPCGTMGRDGHVGQSHVGWDTCMGVPRTVPPIPCGTMGRDGHVGQSHVGWDTWESLGQSHPSHVGQWDGTKGSLRSSMGPRES